MNLVAVAFDGDLLVAISDDDDVDEKRANRPLRFQTITLHVEVPNDLSLKL